MIWVMADALWIVQFTFWFDCESEFEDEFDIGMNSCSSSCWFTIQSFLLPISVGRTGSNIESGITTRRTTLTTRLQHAISINSILMSLVHLQSVDIINPQARFSGECQSAQMRWEGSILFVALTFHPFLLSTLSLHYRSIHSKDHFWMPSRSTGRSVHQSSFTHPHFEYSALNSLFSRATLPSNLSTDIEWKLVYVGSPDSEEIDQELDDCMVGPVPIGQ